MNQEPVFQEPRGIYRRGRGENESKEMAGEWIKVEKATPDKPEVLRIARELAIDRDAVFGKLMLIWMWFDANSVDGYVDGAVDADIDELVRWAGFAKAMRNVKWLASVPVDNPEDDSVDNFHGGLCLPNFHRHNGETTKKRGLRNKRQAKWREKASTESSTPSSTSTSTQSSTPASTNTSTREEKRREDKDKSNVELKLDAVQVLQFLNAKTGRNYEPVPVNLEMIVARMREGATVGDLKAVVAMKCREWSGDEEMSKYLRPETLFGRKKFAQYKGALGAAPEPAAEPA